MISASSAPAPATVPGIIPAHSLRLEFPGIRPNLISDPTTLTDKAIKILGSKDDIKNELTTLKASTGSSHQEAKAEALRTTLKSDLAELQNYNSKVRGTERAKIPKSVDQALEKFNTALKLAQSGDSVKASGAFNDIIESVKGYQGPEVAHLYLARALHLTAMGALSNSPEQSLILADLDKARKLTKSPTIIIKAIDSYLNIAQQRIGEGNYAEALKLMRIGAACRIGGSSGIKVRRDKFSETYTNLAISEFEKGNHSKSIKHFGTAFKIANQSNTCKSIKDVTAFWHYAKALLAKGLAKESFSALSEAANFLFNSSKFAHYFEFITKAALDADFSKAGEDYLLWLEKQPEKARSALVRNLQIPKGERNLASDYLRLSADKTAKPMDADLFSPVLDNLPCILTNPRDIYFSRLQESHDASLQREGERRSLASAKKNDRKIESEKLAKEFEERVIAALNEKYKAEITAAKNAGGDTDLAVKAYAVDFSSGYPKDKLLEARDNRTLDSMLAKLPELIEGKYGESLKTSTKLPAKVVHHLYAAELAEIHQRHCILAIKFGMNEGRDYKDSKMSRYLNEAGIIDVLQQTYIPKIYQGTNLNGTYAAAEDLRKLLLDKKFDTYRDSIKFDADNPASVTISGLKAHITSISAYIERYRADIDPDVLNSLNLKKFIAAIIKHKDNIQHEKQDLEPKIGKRWMETGVAVRTALTLPFQPLMTGTSSFVLNIAMGILSGDGIIIGTAFGLVCKGIGGVIGHFILPKLKRDLDIEIDKSKGGFRASMADASTSFKYSLEYLKKWRMNYVHYKEVCLPAREKLAENNAREKAFKKTLGENAENLFKFAAQELGIKPT